MQSVWLLQEGILVKLADDLYCGANTPEHLLENWKRVLHTLHQSSLNLSAPKTVICPRTTTILGWIWHQGTIQASPHRIATLTSCSPPTTVAGMRSFIGAYKVLSQVLPKCASLLAPLDSMIGGHQSSDPLTWTDDLLQAFQCAQSALLSNKTITLPHPEDQLWIVTDGAVKNHGIGATLYVTRNGKPHLPGFFSAKLKSRQTTWLPCEIEALSIAVATKHFSPYIIQSHHKTCILSDSKPCVQAFEKLCRGEFSASPRVSTFLSVVSRYQASIRHLAGSANIPSDFASRNAAECHEPNCQICSFVQRMETSTVCRTSIQDIIQGKVKLPFTSRAAWLSIQAECSDLRRTHAHLTQGTRPSKKLTKVKDVKRYLGVATVARDGLLVVKREEPMFSTRECIIVPRQIMDGLTTSVHIQLQHPTCHQLKMVMRRYFYALDMDKIIEQTTASCHQCASIQNVPHSIVEQSTQEPPEAIGVSFAADIMKRTKQCVLVLRECVTSYTTTRLIENEQHDTIRDSLISMCIELRPLDGPLAVIRTDPAPGFVALVNDPSLRHHRLCIEIGRVKNPNKNPVADKAIQELEYELKRQDATSGPITPLNLSIATAQLNSRFRSRGISARELWTQRDQFNNCQIPFSDQQMSRATHCQSHT